MRDSEKECSSMDASMIIKGSAEDTGITTFESEACVATDVIDSYVPNKLSVPQVDLQDIKAYFARPRLISRGNIPFGSYAQLTPGFAFAANQATMITIFPQWTQRLAGAYGIRFKLNFRLQVAATSFHQGVICMNWQYNKTGVSDKNYTRGTVSYASTNLPHVRLDLAKETMTELSIPFLYPTEYMVINPTTVNEFSFDYGQLILVPILSSVSVAGLAPATYQLFCYLTDIELFGADVINPSTVVLQGPNILTKESGIVSSSLDKAAKITEFVGGMIPSLTGIAGPASWALETASGVAKYFGYSKPLVTDHPHRVYQSRNGTEYQVDTPMVGTTIAPMMNNSTIINSSLGATDVDEMALKFVTGCWSQVCRGDITTGDVHGNAIYASPVSPSVMWFRAPSAKPYCNIRFPSNSTGITTGNCFYPTSLMSIASMFRLWRGSIKFRFTFAKTALHGGRYMVTYNPAAVLQRDINNFGGQVEGPEVVSGLTQPYGNSAIFDLKDDNVFEFEVPYVSALPYTSFSSSIGSITMICMDPLQATATVTPTVPFLVEVCGGSDFELNDYAGVYFVHQPEGTVVLQSAKVDDTMQSNTSQTTLGERLTSLKQLIMIPSSYTVNISGSGGNPIKPWFINSSYGNVKAIQAIPNPANGNANTFDGAGFSGAYLAPFYAFCKGGTDVHIYSRTTGSTIKVHQVASPFQALPVTSLRDYSNRPFVSGVSQVNESVGTAVHARLPSFQTIARIPTTIYNNDWVGFANPTAITVYAALSHFYRYSVRGNDTVELHVAAADDAQLAHYMGPVPMMIPGAGATVNMDSQTAAYV